MSGPTDPGEPRSGEAAHWQAARAERGGVAPAAKATAQAVRVLAGGGVLMAIWILAWMIFTVPADQGGVALLSFVAVVAWLIYALGAARHDRWSWYLGLGLVGYSALDAYAIMAAPGAPDAAIGALIVILLGSALTFRALVRFRSSLGAGGARWWVVLLAVAGGFLVATAVGVSLGALGQSTHSVSPLGPVR